MTNEECSEKEEKASNLTWGNYFAPKEEIQL